jgi:hypothetical protein
MLTWDVASTTYAGYLKSSLRLGGLISEREIKAFERIEHDNTKKTAETYDANSSLNVMLLNQDKTANRAPSGDKEELVTQA